MITLRIGERGPADGAARQVLEEKLVKRGVSLKGARLRQGRRGHAEHACARWSRSRSGISSDKAREINKLIKEIGAEGRQQPDAGRPASGSPARSATTCRR